MDYESLITSVSQGEIPVPENFQPIEVSFSGTRDYYYRGDTRNCYTLHLAQGPLNDFLEEPIVFCDLPGEKEFSFMFGVVYGDLDLLHSLGESGAVSLCHEIGHSMNPDEPGAIVSPSIEGTPNTPSYKLEEFRAYLEHYSMIWKTEVQAWEYGKVIADLMGIDENLYHARMTRALTGYYANRILQTIDDLKYLLKHDLINLEEEIEYYDIWLQEDVTVPLAEFKVRTVDREDEIVALRDSLRPFND